SRNYYFVRRRRPLARPNEITSDSDETAELSRKIRSTTPDSREIGGTRVNGETGRRYRSRLQPSADDSVPAEASAVPRGQFRPRLNREELISLTPIDIDSDIEAPVSAPKPSFAPRRFRGRTSTTVADKAEDSEVSAATLDVRPSILPRGRGRFSGSTTTESIEPSTSEASLVARRPAFTKFTPRPFTRSTTASRSGLDEQVEEEVSEDVTRKISPRLPFGRVRPSTSTPLPTFQARKVSFPSRQSTTPRILTSDIDEEEQDKHEDITLSESALSETEHEDNLDEEINETPKRIVIKRLRTPSSSTTESPIATETIPINDLGKRKFRVIRRRPTSTAAPEEPSVAPTEPTRNKIRKVIRKKIRPIEDEPEILAKSIGSLNAVNKESSTEIVTNYGEKTKTSIISITTEAPSSTTPELEKELDEQIVENENNSNDETNIENGTIAEENNTEHPQTNQSNIKEETTEKPADEPNIEAKPEVSLETSQKEIIISEAENENQASLEPSSEIPPVTEVEESSPETTPSTTTTQTTSPSSRSRAPYRPLKRVFTSTTESTSAPSSRIFSRKFNPGVYTSPATVDKDTFKPSTRRPFSSRTFTRRPFTTSSTTPEPEEDYSEEILEEEPENELVFVPPSKLFTRKPEFNDDDLEDSGDVSEDETFEEQKPNLTSRKPFVPRVVNSNTFRTSTSTTELPKRLSGSLNRTSIYNRTSPNKPVDPKAKRVQNVPVGYNRPAEAPVTETSVANEASETTNENTEETTTNIFSDDFDMSTGDDYLSMTEGPGTTLTDSDETLSTNTLQTETATAEMEINGSTDDYLENTEQTTNYPSTHDTTFNAQTETDADDRTTEVTTEPIAETTPVPTVPPVIKTQFNKLFSVSRVVEVSSKLDKHRLNKNNETRLIEEGKIMVEKKPVVDKIGEVSRYSLIKIVEDEIPIYLTKYGHIYPVENPPDNPIRIDEGRNARALSNFADGPKENLVASESINEAYRHVTKEANKPSSEVPKHTVEHIESDDFLSYINNDNKTDKNSDNTYSQWQFVPAAYENEQNKLNKAAKSFEVVTPRSMLTDPSTLPLEALFKTEVPVMARRMNNDQGSQPFVVYSASVPSQKDDASIVKVDVLKPEVGRSIITFAKGQEFQGASVDQSTIQYPVNITILSQTSDSPSSTTIMSITSTTETVNTSPIIDLLTTPAPTTLTTEAQTITTMEIPSTTETIADEITTVKISPLDAKRKFAFPRRPIVKPSNFTRPSPTPRVSKKINATVVSNNLKSNKTSGFNPTKSRFTANRAQNVPIDFRKKTNTTKLAPKAVTKSFTTEAPRTTTERKLYFKPIRPISVRPAFVPRKSTTPKVSGDT
ncbi:mucin-2-like, partial [Cydia splendana]|uniref:mucin-2-like n=1 Tax=Cydia splendana TaxID=1100963 RepID=UPI00300D8497